jgi:twitching motility protein PilJ
MSTTIDNTLAGSGAIDSIAGRARGIGSNVWIWLLLISLLVFAANTLYATTKAARFGGASTAASSLQVNSQRLANQARDAVSGNAEAFAEFKATRQEVDDALRTLNDNFGASEVGAPIKTVTDRWTELGKNATQLTASERAVLALAGNADRFTQRVPQLQAQLDEVVRAMSASGAPSSQIYIALRQVVLAATMARRIAELRAGGAGAAAASTALRRDIAFFQQVMDGLREGGEGEAQRVTGAALAPLTQANTLWVEMKQDVDAILASSADLLSAQNAASALASGSDQLLTDSENLFASLTAFGSLRDTSIVGGVWVSILSGALALVSLIGLYFSTRSAERARLQSTLELNNRNQEAIMRLLDEMGSLAEGDLTVKATVTEDMTGAIADSINFAVEQLRSLVQTITDTSVQVASSAQETQATAMHLAEAAEHQAQEINSASDRISEIAASIDQVSKNSAESAGVAQRSVQIATKGAGVVRETIAGMDSIRDQIQETSKRIKRLGESSQEIGSIVELINDISEQTNILALNAAIQAASAGEAGRGFAVVADEVQRLAERASNATKRIETLVQTIQSDTNEAVTSMEQTTSEVVAGARLAEDAGTALGEIESVSTNLADLIQGISAAAQQQSTAASNITSAMHTIQSITAQTSQGANQTAQSIGTLAQLAADLRRSVADFKLPA